MSDRENILKRVRGLEEGREQRRIAMTEYVARRALGPRPGSNWDLVMRFKERALGLLSSVDETNGMQEAPSVVARYLSQNGLPSGAVCWPGLAHLPWAASELAVEPRAANGDDLVGITGVFCAIAETGTLMLLSGEYTHAVTSLLPETHIAIVKAARIVASMEDGWSLLRSEVGALPRAVNFVSGPSRTADIEQTITLGAHGPYRLHIIVVKE
ncbi:MAG TPA: lactate utilization protein C [Burkholderiales bacterium]|nr:lactate utilization protein C [Burkholderiales bacterium]